MVVIEAVAFRFTGLNLNAQNNMKRTTPGELTAHSAQRTAHSAQRTAHSAQRTAHSAQRTAHSAQRTAHSAQHKEPKV